MRMSSIYLREYEDRYRGKLRRLDKPYKRRSSPSCRKRRRSSSNKRSRSPRTYSRYYKSKRTKRARSPHEIDSEGHLKFSPGDEIGGKCKYIFCFTFNSAQSKAVLEPNLELVPTKPHSHLKQSQSYWEIFNNLLQTKLLKT